MEIACEQGSAQWMQHRLGRCTGSRVKDALSFLRNGESSQKRKDYLVDLVAERLTGAPADHYVSREMEFGNAMEPLARAAYEERTGNDLSLVGLYQHDEIEMFSASPDALLGQDGLVEIKCPKTSTHLSWMMAGVVPEEHALQMYAELACSGKAFCDFASFDPRLSPRHQLFIKRLWRDDKIIAEIEDGVLKFLAEVDAMIAALNERNPPLPEPAYDDLQGEGLTEDIFNDACFTGQEA